MRVNARTGGRSTECEFLQLSRNQTNALDALPDLCCVARELLTKSNGRRVHEVSSSRLQNSVEFCSLLSHRIVHVLKSRY